MSSNAAQYRSPQMERVDMRRSLSLPSAAGSKKLATREYLRAAEKGNLNGVRLLALEADAELFGRRTKNSLGCDPMHLIDSSHHLTLEHMQALKEQFKELPQLINAVKSAKALPSRPSKSLSKTTSEADDGFASRLASKASKASMVSKATTPALAKTAGLAGQFARSENTLTRLASTLGAPEQVANAAKTQPLLLWESAHKAEKALPALSRALKSEALAVQAVHDNPALLRIDPLKIKKIMPALIAVLQGSTAEAAYAVSKMPEILELERPAGLQEGLKAVASCMGNLKDAMWLVGQITAPPSIKIVARKWSREDVIGEYFRIDGAQMDDKPVWCKPARFMSHLGSKAKDVFLVYCEKGIIGGDSQQGCWTITPNYLAKSKRSETCDVGVIGWAPSTLQSPDQIPEGSWHFPSEAHPTQTPQIKHPGQWPADPYVNAMDGGRARGAWLYAQPAPKLRQCYDMLREAVGPVWCHAENSSCTAPKLVSSPCKGDLVHTGGTAKFVELNGLTGINGFIYLQLPASLPADAPPIILTAWEPVQIIMFYSSAHPKEEPPLDGEASSPPEAEEPAETEHTAHADILYDAGFRASLKPTLPTIGGAPELAPDVFIRAYPCGHVEIPVPLGPGGLPPLIFVKAHASARTKNGLSSFEVVKPKANAEVYIPDVVKPGDETAKGEVAEAADGETQDVPAKLTMLSPGELGYNEWLFLAGSESDAQAEDSENQVSLEAADNLKVAVALFHLPEKQEEAEEDGEESVAASQTTPKGKQVPAVPSWLEEDGWNPVQVRLPMILNRGGEHIPQAYLYGKDLAAGNSLYVKGSGAEFVTFTLLKQTSAARPDPLRPLLLREPALLAACSNVDLLMDLMRTELGDSFARHVVISGAGAIPELGTGIESPSKGSGADGFPRASWPKLCQQGSAADIRAWVFEHKLDTLTVELGGRRPGARHVLRSLSKTKVVTVPQIEDRCPALREVLGVDSVALLEVLTKQARLLAEDATVYRKCFELIARYLPTDRVKAHFRAWPMHVIQPDDLAHLFAKLNERYDDNFISRRLQERTWGEWIRWPDMVGLPDANIVSWIGRVGVEERELSCKNRVISFGAAPYGASAIADATGALPVIPPLVPF